jgi:hypothetical protein
MEESGGRRIKRSVLIDINSIRFCTPDMVERFARIHRIKDYVAQKQGELREHNERNQIDDSVLVNGRRMTNVGTFRAYLVNYLRAHPKVHQEMTFLVRQLAPGERGLPIEIYVFSSDQAWVNYEDIQADIFDHIFAVLPEFGLRPFQNPAGADIASAIERLRIDHAPRNKRRRDTGPPETTLFSRQRVAHPGDSAAHDIQHAAPTDTERPADGVLGFRFVRRDIERIADQAAASQVAAAPPPDGVDILEHRFAADLRRAIQQQRVARLDQRRHRVLERVDDSRGAERNGLRRIRGHLHRPGVHSQARIRPPAAECTVH